MSFWAAMLVNPIGGSAMSVDRWRFSTRKPVDPQAPMKVRAMVSKMRGTRHGRFTGRCSYTEIWSLQKTVKHTQWHRYEVPDRVTMRKENGR